MTKLHFWAVIGLCLGLVVSEPTLAQSQTTPSNTGTNARSELVSRLVKQLSVTPTQARGGAGALFSLAKNRLSPSEFGKVAAAVPNMKGLLNSAPSSGGLSALSGISGGQGSLGGLADMASVSGAFQKLGLSSNMISNFVPIILNYVESRGGSSTSSLLAKVFPGIQQQQGQPQQSQQPQQQQSQPPQR